MKLFSSKRGDDIELWFNTFELLIVFVACGVLIQTINSEARVTTYEKIYLARDNALLLNTIYAAPGDVRYNYAEKTGAFILDFKQNEVKVYEDYELIEGGAIGYPFAEDNTYTITYTKVLPKKSEGIAATYSKDKDSLKIN